MCNFYKFENTSTPRSGCENPTMIFDLVGGYSIDPERSNLMSIQSDTQAGLALQESPGGGNVSCKRSDQESQDPPNQQKPTSAGNQNYNGSSDEYGHVSSGFNRACQQIKSVASYIFWGFINFVKNHPGWFILIIIGILLLAGILWFLLSSLTIDNSTSHVNNSTNIINNSTTISDFSISISENSTTVVKIGDNFSGSHINILVGIHCIPESSNPNQTNIPRLN